MGSVNDLKDAITAAVGRWERKAKGETYLDTLLHPRAKGWLVDELMAALAPPAETTLRSKKGVKQ